MRPLFNKDRVETAGRFIADVLLKLLEPMDYKSHIGQCLREACPAYKAGLNNGELRVATLRALALVQLEVAASLVSLKESERYDDDEEDAVALPEATS